jgi:hypothetical protein
MLLEEFIKNNLATDLDALAVNLELTRDIQKRLSDIGLLDPPVDGRFGPVSHWALGQFAATCNMNAEALTPSLMEALLSASKPPLVLDGSLASRIVSALVARGDWLCLHPDCINIVYIEGMDVDGTANANHPNQFNDIRCLIRFVSGRPELLNAWEATTEPGKFFTENPEDVKGAARIALGQYKAWGVGIHRENHEALIQTADVTVCRDLNKDYSRSGDKRYTGAFGINQHWGYDNPRSDIGRASAGCLVGRTKQGHKQFMALVKSDPRYEANHSYRFMTSIIESAAISPAAQAVG